MPQFVTDPFSTHRATASSRSNPRPPLDERARAALAYRHRLVALKVRAPDTLRARVRRELRAAASAAVTRP